MDFKKQPMVNWFLPASLLKTGIETLLSSVFGRYADRREVQAALTQNASIFHYDDQTELWFDYVADLGDGFNSTYTVATALAQAELAIDDKVLPRGRFLVMGGDQVYPSASAENYDNRLQGPYEHALPRPSEISDKDPHLYALPGNHDWYDGLTAFLRLFVQGRYIGGWRTQQQRSYFTLALPNDCWLFAIDIQLGADLDWPQKSYFKKSIEKLTINSRVIIVSAVPSWIEESLRGKTVAESLHYVETKITEKKAKIVANIAGDFHHYAHYENEKHHLITCGGGGAFAHGTHDLPDTLQVNHHQQLPKEYQLTKVFPEKSTSLKTLLGNLFFALKNKAMATTLGAYYLLLILSIQINTLDSPNHWFAQLQLGAGIQSIHFVNLAQNMTLLVLSLVMLFGMIAFYDARPSRSSRLETIQRWFVGSLHGGVHLTSSVWLAACVFPLLYQSGIQSLYLTVPFYWLLASIVGGTIFGIYLLLSNLALKAHDDAAFSSNQIEDYKSFLRFHVSAEGELTVYTIGISQIIRDWSLDNSNRYVSQSKIADHCHIIETFKL